eukprot:CAMPEP_0177678210 /NCGR_PEP_ID=MMETSP0447-20121125/28885_1 /TAXON_ID=0 /ORGANISM="Stygamoeba regulata, Strain BSH-02190019" /LENGTH=68 /DNA_ID=CAMNT_0019187193 /DNA_START=192 /DNA_END=398 /DNA_ORIENTATION=-
MADVHAFLATLVGQTGEQARAAIGQHFPGKFQVDVLSEDSMVTMDYVPSRIRVFVNAAGVVTAVPQPG